MRSYGTAMDHKENTIFQLNQYSNMADESPNVCLYSGTQTWNEPHFLEECGRITSYITTSKWGQMPIYVFLSR